MTHSTTTHHRIHPAGATPRQSLHALRTPVDRGVDRRVEGTEALRIVDRRVGPRRAAERVVRPPAERWSAAALFTGSTLLVAIIGAVVTNRGMSWYDRLDRASFNPPDAVFGPVWSSLYAINAIAGFLVWRASRSAVPTIVWSAALGLNLLWTIAFFGLHRPAIGLFVIGALWTAIVAFAIVARPRDPTATWLMLPYLSWVTFAGVLNVAIARAN